MLHVHFLDNIKLVAHINFIFSVFFSHHMVTHALEVFPSSHTREAKLKAFSVYFQHPKIQAGLSHDWLRHSPRWCFLVTVWRKLPIHLQLDSWGLCLEASITCCSQATSHCPKMAAILKCTAKKLKWVERERLNTLILWELHSSPELTSHLTVV